MDMAKVEDWLEGIPSPQTRKSYKNGLKKFEEYYGKGIETLIGSDEAGKTVEKFYVWLKDKGHPQNTCRNLTNAPIQFLKYFGTPVKYRKNLGIYKTTLTSRDHLLTVDEVRQMWQIASLAEKIMIKTWMLGLRIGDASKIQWQQFNFKTSEEPKEVLINTRKESIIAHVFVDAEFQKLLEKYIPTLDQKNKYLIQSEKGGNLKEKQLLRRLQSLQKKAGIQSNRQVFGWHIGRKLFLRTCAELGITSWNAQMMCGKAVDKSIATYINGVQLKNDAMKVHNVLKMEVSNGNNGKVTRLEETVNALERENMTFKTRIDLLQKNLQMHENENAVFKTRIDSMQKSIEIQNKEIGDQNKTIAEQSKHIDGTLTDLMKTQDFIMTALKKMVDGQPLNREEKSVIKEYVED
jgi:integrase